MQQATHAVAWSEFLSQVTPKAAFDTLDTVDPGGASPAMEATEPERLARGRRPAAYTSINWQ